MRSALFGGPFFGMVIAATLVAVRRLFRTVRNPTPDGNYSHDASGGAIAGPESHWNEAALPQLRAAHDKLMGEHRALEREFEELTKNPLDIDAHEKFLDKLAAHRSELRQHSAEVHRHADWLQIDCAARRPNHPESGRIARRSSGRAIGFSAINRCSGIAC